MLDAHFHLDKYQNPYREIQAILENKIRAIAVSNNINSYVQTHLLAQDCKGISVAIGLHPAEAARYAWELEEVLAVMEAEPYIGEIGLDGKDPVAKRKRSAHDIDQQILVLEQILETCEDKNKVITLHSQDAVPILLEIIAEKRLSGVIWHWYTGDEKHLQRIMEIGHYISIGVSAAQKKSRMGNWLGDWIPHDRVLTETDGPFGDKGLLRRDVLRRVHYALAEKWKCSVEDAEEQVMRNFHELTRDIPQD